MAFWRKANMLRKLVSFLGLLAGAGCTVRGSAKDLEGRKFKLEFPITPEQDREIAGPTYVVMDEWTDIRFGDALRFSRLDETVLVSAYRALTPSGKGEAQTGRFTMQATLRRGYTGGPPGSATELFVEVNDVRLMGRLPRPMSLPGTKAIVPGEYVLRRIAEGELPKVDDRYVVNLAARQRGIVQLRPWPEAFRFELTIVRDGAPVPVAYDPEKLMHYFDTGSGGTHELRIRVTARAAREPDSYHLICYWGDGLSEGGPLMDRQIGWKEGPGPGSGRSQPKH